MTASLYREIDALGGVGNGDYHQGFSDAKRLFLEVLERRGFGEAADASDAGAYGWIEWAGGECPVGPGTRLDVRFRNGASTEGFYSGVSASARDWRHDGSGIDIVAYRPVRP